MLQFGPEPARHERSPHLHVISAPVDLLREIHIVDTPGTNAVIREHEAITAEFVPRSDLVLFVTSADRPFTESERLFLDGVREWGKKILVVINKVDLFETPAQLEEVRELRRRAGAPAARDRTRNLPRQRAPGAARQGGRPGGLGAERLRAARDLHS